MIRSAKAFGVAALVTAGAIAVIAASSEKPVQDSGQSAGITYRNSEKSLKVGTKPGGVVPFGGGKETKVPQGFEIATFGAG